MCHLYTWAYIICVKLNCIIIYSSNNTKLNIQNSPLFEIKNVQ